MHRFGNDLTIGVEEEYLLVDPETRALAAKPPSGFMARCKEQLGNRVSHEFLQAQVEIGTGVCRKASDARAELIELRQCVAEAAEEFGMRITASSTHPWSHWRDQHPVEMDRYRVLSAEHPTVLRRMAICGMHVHAGIEDKNRRVDVMSQVSYFLPHLLALSSSSPFWEGSDTGLKSFRPTMLSDLPRSGLPEDFESWHDWEEMLLDLSTTGVLHDPSRIWWDVRPSNRHPTLEMRMCDLCTWVDDAVTIAALYQSILGLLIHLRENNLRWRSYRRLLIQENKWQAQRAGVDAELADFGKRTMIPLPDLIDEMVEILLPHAEELGCVEEVENARVIARRGSSADHQLKVYRDALAHGMDDHQAQIQVVDWLIEQSVAEKSPGLPS